MKNVNKRIKRDGIKILYVYNRKSAKGNPTAKSDVITIAYKTTVIGDEIECSIGTAVKVPNDEFIPRVGKAIAVRRMEENKTFFMYAKNITTDEKIENDILDNLHLIINKPVKTRFVAIRG